MKKYLPNVIALVLVGALIWFISVSGKAQQAPPQQEKTITLRLPVSQIDAILGALAKLPYEQSAPVINAIMQQAQPQVQAPLPQKDSSSPKPKGK